MNHLLQRAALTVASGLLILIVVSGCTLTGSDSAPVVTPITELPTIAPTPSPKPIIPTPSPQPTVNVFGTATAVAQAQSALTLTPGGPGVTAVGVTGTPATPGFGPTAKPPVTSSAGGGQTSGGSTACPATYTVVAGDTLFRIALKFGLTVQELATANAITNTEFISVGQVLKIPKCGGATAGGETTTGGQTTGGTTAGTLQPKGDDTVASNGDILHVVKVGENLFRIALNYGLSWEVVANYNGITNPNAISVGQTIRIPTK